MRTIVAGTLLGLASLLAAVGGVLAYRDRPPDSRFEPPRVVQRRQRAIHAELTRSSSLPFWAGSYYCGDGLGSNNSLDLAPKVGFVMTEVGCFGLYRAESGSVSEDGQRLRLDDLPPSASSAAVSSELVLVPWASRVYLIPPERMMAFAEDVRLGVEPRAEREGHWLLGVGHELAPASGLPRLPSAHGAALDGEPIEATILSVRAGTVPPRPSSHLDQYILELDLDTNGGAFVGLELHVVDRKTTLRARVIEVGESTSQARMPRYDFQADQPAPRTGWRLQRPRPMKR